VTIQADSPGKPISKDLIGVFFEDLSYAADGGLYAELVQNRSFEYSPADHDGWHGLTSWELLQSEGGNATLTTGTASPLHPNNPHHAVLSTFGGTAGLKNSGFDGIPVKSGDPYRFSVFTRQLDGNAAPLVVRLESKSGGLLAESKLPPATADWNARGTVLKAAATDPDARLVVLTSGTGKLALDMISLFPEKTFKLRPNGLRADLAQAIADLKPRFMRFPGGCLVHGDGLGNIYHWKNTIGPVEQRKGQSNIWQYHQSAGLGYFEYFQFCEDIGAKPLPVVAAGVCCQNSGARITRKWGQGQQGLPLDQMPAYIQDVLDLIEYANGPATSTWGAKRAAAGHPEPFHLQYLGVGNEDHITPVFRERFQMIHDAVKQQHPEITVIGTVGPSPDGEDYEKGWQIADELRVAMVDEHYYQPPRWFWENLRRYDRYDRGKSKVYLGEYAAHDDKRRSTLRSAIAEAAYLTSLERNGDIVAMASYAPLLAKLGHTHWSPNLIYFDNTAVFPTINYHVQQMFSHHSGDLYLTTETADAAGFAASAVRDSATGDLIIKLVNGANSARPVQVKINGAAKLPAEATRIFLAGNDPSAVNEPVSSSIGIPLTTKPVSSSISIPLTTRIRVAPEFECKAPANSLTVIRIGK
jgi:alpha-L-arabinofuranosidase